MTSFYSCKAQELNTTVGNSSDIAPKPAAYAKPAVHKKINKKAQATVAAPKAEEQSEVNVPKKSENHYDPHSLQGEIKREVQMNKAIKAQRRNDMKRTKQELRQRINNTLHDDYDALETWKHRQLNIIHQEREVARNFTHEIQNKLDRKDQELEEERNNLEKAVENLIKEFYQLKEKSHMIRRAFINLKADEVILNDVRNSLNFRKLEDEYTKAQYELVSEIEHLKTAIARMKTEMLSKTAAIVRKTKDVIFDKKQAFKNRVNDHYKERLRDLINSSKDKQADKVKYHVRLENAFNNHVDRVLNRTIVRELQPESRNYLKRKLLNQAVANQQSENQESQQKPQENAQSENDQAAPQQKSQPQENDQEHQAHHQHHEAVHMLKKEAAKREIEKELVEGRRRNLRRA